MHFAGFRQNSVITSGTSRPSFSKRAVRWSKFCRRFDRRSHVPERGERKDRQLRPFRNRVVAPPEEFSDPMQSYLLLQCIVPATVSRCITWHGILQVLIAPACRDSIHHIQFADLSAFNSFVPLHIRCFTRLPTHHLPAGFVSSHSRLALRRDLKTIGCATACLIFAVW